MDFSLLKWTSVPTRQTLMSACCVRAVTMTGCVCWHSLRLCDSWTPLLLRLCVVCQSLRWKKM